MSDFDKAKTELEKLRKKFMVSVLFFAGKDKKVLSVMNSKLMAPFPEEVRNAMAALQDALQNWCDTSDFISLGKSEFKDKFEHNLYDIIPDDEDEM